MAVPLALFSLFDTLSGTSIFSIDYLIAFTTLFIPNILTISLFVLVKKENLIGFLIGLMLTVVEVIAMVIIFLTLEFTMLCTVLIILCAVGGITLTVKSIYLPSRKPLNLM